MKRLCFFSILSVLLFVSLASCSMQRRCERRLAFVDEHCPDMFEEFVVVDTVIKEEWKADTTFVMSHDTVVDTFLFEHENIAVKLIKIHDTLKVSVESKPDTIIKPMYVKVPEHVVESHHNARFGAIVICALAIFALGWFLSKKTRL